MEEFVAVPGARLWTATSGRGLPLLLCHGGPGHYDYLEPRDPSVVAALERDWEVALAGIGSRLRSLSMPALVVHGEADPIGEDGPRELASSLPGARFVVLPGVGDLPWLEGASGLRSELRRFVRRLRTLVPDGA